MNQCFACKNVYLSSRALTMHLNHSQYCMDRYYEQQHNSFVSPFNIPLLLNNSTNENSTLVHNEIFIANSYEPIINCYDQILESISTESDNNSNISESSNCNLYHDNNIIHEIKLVKILNDMGAPLYAYENIIEWARNAHLQDFKFQTYNKTYKQLIKHLETKMHLGLGRPQKNNSCKFIW